MFFPVECELKLSVTAVAVFVKDLAADGKVHMADLEQFFPLVSRRIWETVCIQLTGGGSHLRAAVVSQPFEPVSLLSGELPRQIP